MAKQIVFTTYNTMSCDTKYDIESFPIFVIQAEIKQELTNMGGG